LWFLHDGASPCISNTARLVSNDTHPEQWVGQGKPIAWPAGSYDLILLDFYLLGHLRSIVNTVPFNYVAELQQGAEDRRELICHMPEI
jgi:hypothetical protein